MKDKKQIATENTEATEKSHCTHSVISAANIFGICE
jgi:hypothetical protein